ncbi:hypothetical protein T440DRAFT_77974 [Plenodomus tracheiphilus IPT5]|uniref:Uncharacterized protein n=1 Tax=Plenodomus tracheiphilus IPT5 TaxID=1408161 RepID=A0A6A7B9F5_9PLEO|nr:hypothetical protein T440DRAFT_77974 [Plenodomus tracheiphilus IPT5]
MSLVQAAHQGKRNVPMYHACLRGGGLEILASPVMIKRFLHSTTSSFHHVNVPFGIQALWVAHLGLFRAVAWGLHSTLPRQCILLRCIGRGHEAHPLRGGSLSALLSRSSLVCLARRHSARTCLLTRVAAVLGGVERVCIRSALFPRQPRLCSSPLLSSRDTLIATATWTLHSLASYAPNTC